MTVHHKPENWGQAERIDKAGTPIKSAHATDDVGAADLIPTCLSRSYAMAWCESQAGAGRGVGQPLGSQVAEDRSVDRIDRRAGDAVAAVLAELQPSRAGDQQGQVDPAQAGEADGR